MIEPIFFLAEDNLPPSLMNPWKFHADWFSHGWDHKQVGTVICCPGLPSLARFAHSALICFLNKLLILLALAHQLVAYQLDQLNKLSQLFISNMVGAVAIRWFTLAISIISTHRCYDWRNDRLLCAPRGQTGRGTKHIWRPQIFWPPLVIYIIHTTSDLLSAIWRLFCGCHMCMFPKVLRIHVVGAEPTKEGVTAKCFMTGLIQLYRSYEGPIPIPLLLQASPLTLTSVWLELHSGYSDSFLVHKRISFYWHSLTVTLFGSPSSHCKRVGLFK